jgi:RNA polymerase sigma-70 factor (ECF subfamily)
MPERFEELIDRHHDELFAYLWRLLGPQRQSDVSLDVEDLVQEVFMRAYQAYPSLRDHSNHRAWLYKIATNCALTKLRQLKSRGAKLIAMTCPAASSDSVSLGERLTGQVRQAIKKLPTKQKACLTLYYLEDLDYPEIAETVGCTEVSARANVYQALRRLRRELKEDQ